MSPRAAVTCGWVRNRQWVRSAPRTSAPRIDLWVGMHDAAHATALGKCILGQLPGLARDDYLARHPLHDLTPRTVVDPRHLRLPARGEIAVDDGEYAVGVCCLASTVTTGRDVGALGVVVPPREVGRPPTRQTLVLAAERVSRAMALGTVA